MLNFSINVASLLSFPLLFVINFYDVFSRKSEFSLILSTDFSAGIERIPRIYLHGF